jgi:hypothetical protein
MSEWQPIETAPKDGTNIDLWAKRWRSDNDGFFYRRFPECYWSNGDSMTNRHANWVHLEEGWYPTHWMPEPEPPK